MMYRFKPGMTYSTLDVLHTRGSEKVAPWVEATEANPGVAHHLNVIGTSCLQTNTSPPYMIQAVRRDKLGFPQQWLGGVDPRTYMAANAEKVG